MTNTTEYLALLRKRRERSLHVEHVTKSYPGGVRALDDVSLAFASGLCGILGPDGAGKSTLMRILAMEERPDRGELRFDGMDGRTHPDRLRVALGTVVSSPPVPAPVPVLVAMEHFAAHHGWSDRRVRLALVEATLRQVDLWETRALRVGELSDAMRWRFSVAITLLTSPTALLLDEPTATLAPNEAAELLSMLRELAEHRLVIVATRDARTLCDLSMQVAMLHRGRVLRAGAVDRLVDDLAGRVWSGTASHVAMLAIKARHVVLAHSPPLAPRSDEHAIIVANELPGPNFVPVEPDLQHVYQYRMALEAHGTTATPSSSPAYGVPLCSPHPSAGGPGTGASRHYTPIGSSIASSVGARLPSTSAIASTSVNVSTGQKVELVAHFVRHIRRRGA